MATKELLDYIVYQLRQGQSQEKIQQDLLNTGWTIEILKEAYGEIAAEHPELNLQSSTKDIIEPLEKITPEEKTVADSFSVDDLVYKKEDEGRATKNPVVSNDFPVDAFNMSSFPVEGIEKENKQVKPDSYAIDSGNNNSNIENEKKVISINVEKVEAEPKIINREPIINPTIQKEGAAIAANPQKEAKDVKPNIQPKKKSGSLVGIIIILVLLILLIGGSAFAYFNYLAPEKIAANVMNKLSELKSVDFSGKTGLKFAISEEYKEKVKEAKENSGFENSEFDLEEPDFFGIDADVNGKFNFKNENDFMNDLSMNINYTDSMDQKNSLVFGEKTYGNNLYLKVENVSLSNSYSVDPALTVFFGKWIRVIKSDSEQKSLSEFFSELIKYASSNSLSKAFVFEVKGVEKVNDSYCLKTRVYYDKQKLKEAILVIMNDEGTTEGEIQSFNENYDEAYDEWLSKVETTVWVGILDSNIYKVNMVYSNTVEYGEVSFTSTFNFSNHNKDVEVIAPEGTLEAEEVVNAWTSLLTKGTANNFTDNEIRSAMEQARLIAENYKNDNGSYEGLEVSNDMNRSINDDVNKWGGEAAIFFNSKDKYCLSKKFVEENGSWCVDSSSFVAPGICNKDQVKCIQEGENNGENSNSSTTTNTVINPEDINGGKKELINQLKKALDDQKTNKETYLGVVSSKFGIDLVKQINEEESTPINIYTSKQKYCAMKKFSDGTYYCIDSAGFTGAGEDCDNKSFVCNSETTD